MGPCTKDGFKTPKLMGSEDLFTLMAMFIMAAGTMIRRTDKVFTVIWTGPSTKAIGKKINSMDKVSKLGLMVPGTMVLMSLERSME